MLVFRYITRAILIPFSDSSAMSAAERVEADGALKKPWLMLADLLV